MIAGHKIRLRAKKLADARDDYKWQTDPELTRLDAAPMLAMSFAQYLVDYTSELHYLSSTRQAFAVETLEGKHIGNCVYYNIDEAKGEAEVGIMIGDRDYWHRGYGTDACCALVSHIFRSTNLKRIYLKTLDWNIRAHKSFQKCGFQAFGRMNRDGYNFVLMEYYRIEWEKLQSKETATNEK